MQSAATKFGAKFVSLPAIFANEKSTDAIVAAADAFAMDVGIESAIIETKTGFAILRVDGIEPQHNAPFDSVKKDLVSKWRMDEQKKQAYESANALLIKLNAGGTLAGGKSASVGRANGAPIEVLNAAFANAVGAKTIVPASDAFYVLNVKKANAPAADATKMAAVSKEATTALNRAISDDYMAFLNRKYPVKINHKLYKRMFGE